MVYFITISDRVINNSVANSYVLVVKSIDGVENVGENITIRI